MLSPTPLPAMGTDAGTQVTCDYATPFDFEGSRVGGGRPAEVAPRLRLGATLALAVGVLFAGVPAMAESGILSLTATRADATESPTDAVLEVRLLDVSRADAPSATVAAQRFRVEGWPALIRLAYDTAAIDSRMEYRVAARLMSGDRVLLRTTTAYPVLTRGAPDHLSIALERTGAPPAPAAGTDSALAGVTWEASELGGRQLVIENPPTLVFRDDGAFALFGGCNRFRGKVQAADGRLVFPASMAGTRKACPSPRTELEKATLEALASTTGYKRNGPLLVFTNPANLAVARFRKAPG